MSLKELAKEYKESAELCRGRLKELRLELETRPMGDTERLRLRRKASMLASMVRDTIAISRYLERYYD